MSQKREDWIIVDWVDSMGISGWHSQFEDADLNVTSAGILLDDKKDRIRMAMSRSAYSHGEIMEIPKFAVKSVHRINKGSRRKLK